MTPSESVRRGAPASLPGGRPAAPSSDTTHPCVRCGNPVPLDVALCEACNPLGLKQPASSQAHGTVFLAIGLGVVLLAVVGRLALSGIGPFRAQIVGVGPEASGLSVTLAVTNDGSRAGRTTCRLFDPSESGIGPDSTYVQSPPIDPRATATFSTVVTTLGSTVRPVGVTCTGP